MTEEQIGEALEAYDDALLIADAATSAAGAAAPAAPGPAEALADEVTATRRRP